MKIRIKEDDRCPFFWVDTKAGTTWGRVVEIEKSELESALKIQEQFEKLQKFLKRKYEHRR